MQNVKLSPHFKLYEFCVTNSGANVVEANRAYASQEENIKKLTSLAVNVLEPIRAALIHSKNHFNLKYLIVTSGVRTAGTKILNAALKSQHNHCEACDFVVDGTLKNTRRFYEMIMNGEIKGLDHKYISQCILERKKRADGSWSCWIHIAIVTDRFKKVRKGDGRNYTNFPEFFISLDGFKYVLANETNLNKYLQ